ncbi:C-C chemokine receptor type 6-like [Engraulis encrasicolus]|uniref:C-C chemokine receptor type 6-like n=1 Tax=Engraulis encrasicolus TaxID=184585 RepID=UPI002FD3728D
MNLTDVEFHLDFYDDYTFNDSNYENGGSYDGDSPSLPSVSCDIDSFRNWENTLQLYMYSLVCAVGLVGNTVVILSSACRWRKSGMTMTDVYLINMAVADLVFAMALPVTIFYERNGWPVMGVAACKCARGAYSIKLHCSALLLAFLSRDRYTAIVKSKDRHRAQPREICSMASWVGHLLVSLAIWSLAVVLSVPTFLYTRLKQSNLDHDLHQSIAEYNDLTVPAKCVFNFKDGPLNMAILVPVQIFVGFFLPLLVAGFRCVCITVTLLRTKALWRHESVCVVLTVVFAMCHLPYNGALLYQVTNGKTQMSCQAEMTLETVMVVTRGVAYVHSCLYPLLYALTMGVFRCCVQRGAKTNRRPASQQASDLFPAQTQSKETEVPDENPTTTLC